MNNQRGFANSVLIVIIVLLVGVAGYFAFMRKPEPVAQQLTQPVTTQASTTQQPAPSAIVTAQKPETTWKIYQNSKYGFQFSYPSDWKLGTPQLPPPGYRVETFLANGNTAKFETWVHETQIDVLAKQQYKGTFQGHEAYLYDFNACSNEMGSSNACIEKVIQIPVGTGNTTDFSGREYLIQTVIEIRYGVHGNVSQQASLQSSFISVEPILKQILSTFRYRQHD